MPSSSVILRFVYFFQVNYYQNDTEITTDNSNTSDINNDSENNKKQNHYIQNL